MSEQVEMLDNDISSKLEDYVSKLEERMGVPGRVPLIADLASIYSSYVNQIKIEKYLQIFHQILINKVVKVTTELQTMDPDGSITGRITAGTETPSPEFNRLRTQATRFSDIACSISAGTSLLDNKPKINKKIIGDIKDIIIELMM